MPTSSVPVDARRVGILGAGRQALETSGYCSEAGIEIAFFVEEQAPQYERDESVFGAPILSFANALERSADLRVIAAVGSAELRRRLVDRWPTQDYLTMVSPRAWLAADVRVGPGSTVAPRSSLNRLVQVGAHVLINVGAILSHDVEVADFATIGPGCTVGGCARIGAGAFLGIGSTVRDHITIGAAAVVAAGAVVVEDVPAGATVMGVPARSRTAQAAS